MSTDPDLFDAFTTCDACGEPVHHDERVVFSSVPCDIASANAGESATTCTRCAAEIDRMMGGRR